MRRIFRSRTGGARRVLTKDDAESAMYPGPQTIMTLGGLREMNRKYMTWNGVDSASGVVGCEFFFLCVQSSWTAFSLATFYVEQMSLYGIDQA